jgi:hypothetical protein
MNKQTNKNKQTNEQTTGKSVHRTYKLAHKPNPTPKPPEHLCSALHQTVALRTMRLGCSAATQLETQLCVGETTRLTIEV